MIKKRLMALLLAFVFAFSMSSEVSATSGDQISVTSDEQDTLPELDKNDVFVEPVNVEDLPFDVASSEDEASDIWDHTIEDVAAPLNIELDNSGNITSISPKDQPDLMYEVYILQDGEILVNYNSALENSGVETSEWESITLSENVKYFISIVVTNEDTIDSYDGYFSIINSAMVYDYLFYSSADIATLNGNAITRATQYEIESNDVYGTASTLVDGNSMFGKISNPNDKDWYRIQFARDGIATFSLTNIPSGTDYNMGIYGANNAYSSPAYITGCTNSGPVNENFQMAVYSSVLYRCYLAYLTLLTESQI